MFLRATLWHQLTLGLSATASALLDVSAKLAIERLRSARAPRSSWPMPAPNERFRAWAAAALASASRPLLARARRASPDARARPSGRRSGAAPRTPRRTRELIARSHLRRGFLRFGWSWRSDRIRLCTWRPPRTVTIPAPVSKALRSSTSIGVRLQQPLRQPYRPFERLRNAADPLLASCAPSGLPPIGRPG